MRGADGFGIDKRCHRLHIVRNDIRGAILPLDPHWLGSHSLFELFDDILVGGRAVTHANLEAQIALRMMGPRHHERAARFTVISRRPRKGRGRDRSRSEHGV